jgi:hypothetical protein
LADAAVASIMLIKQPRIIFEFFIILVTPSLKRLIKRHLHSWFYGLKEFSSAPFGEFSWCVNCLLYKAQLNYPTKRTNAYICEFSLPPFKGVYLYTIHKTKVGTNICEFSLPPFKGVYLYTIHKTKVGTK